MCLNHAIGKTDSGDWVGFEVLCVYNHLSRYSRYSHTGVALNYILMLPPVINLKPKAFQSHLVTSAISYSGEKSGQECTAKIPEDTWQTHTNILNVYCTFHLSSFPSLSLSCSYTLSWSFSVSSLLSASLNWKQIGFGSFHGLWNTEFLKTLTASPGFICYFVV